VTLELGGNGAVIVHEDANLDLAAEGILWGAFGSAGQACISVQRLYVHEQVFDRFRDLLLARIRKLTVGDPLDPDTIVGGLVDDAAADKAMGLIEDAVRGGAEILCGGGRSGTVVEPTLLVGASEEQRVCREEAFAPIVSLAPYSDVDEVIDRANASDFGLQAGIFTNDLRIAHKAFERLEVGGVIVNDVNTFRVDQMPYGGAKQSGHGREGIQWTVREMTEERLLVVDPR